MTSRPTGCDDQLVSGLRQRWSGALVPLTACCACTDVDLRSTPKPDDRIALSGTFCTGEPYDTARNLRVLFLVDSSSSMRFNDPNDLLVDSIEHLTQRYAAQPNISFAVIRWGSSQVVKENVDYAPIGTDPFLFTNDQVELAAIYARMRQPPTVNPLKYLDGTNFLLALGAATDYLVADIAKNPNESLTSRYIIEFVTDGMPQSATDDPAITRRNILSAVDNLRHAVRRAGRRVVHRAGRDRAARVPRAAPGDGEGGHGHLHAADQPRRARRDLRHHHQPRREPARVPAGHGLRVEPSPAPHHVRRRDRRLRGQRRRRSHRRAGE